MRALWIRLLLLTIGSLAAACASTQPTASSRGATLGIRSSQPSKELAEELELGFNVRLEGRLVHEITEGGPADLAGVRIGDVLISVDGAVLYSQDDLDDLLRVAEPGQRVALQLVRAGRSARVTVDASLGTASQTATENGALHWQHASLVQLPVALGEAREKHKRVLVGLSGAET